jgi:predicted peptidase
VRLTSAAVAASVIATGMLVAPAASASTDGIVSVTAITQVSTWGQRVTAVALEFDGTVDPASITTDGFTVQDSSYNFRFDTIDKLTNLVDREVVAAYTNSEVGLREDGTSMEGDYVILELSDDSPGGWTVRTSTNTMYVKINPNQPTQVFQLADVKGTDGTTLSSARPTFAWKLTEPAVNLEVDEFVHGVFTTSTGANVPYDYRLPDGYDPTQSYPTVVILPGYGMGYDGENARVEIAADIPATAWFQEEWTGTDEKVIVLAIQSPRTGNVAGAAIELIESFKASNAVDPNRVYLSTVSYGSTVAWSILASRSDLIAGVLLTGGFPSSAAQRTAIAAGEVPIWISHGVNDHLLPVANARNSYNALVAAYQARGLSDAAIARLVKWTEFGDELFSSPDHHAVMGPVYEDETYLQWLLAQNKQNDLTSDDGVKVTTSMSDVGGLAMNVAASSVDLGELAMDPSLQFLGAQGDLPTLTVADTRSANPGWSLTVAAQEFRTQNAYTIDAKYLGITPAVLTSAEGQVVTAGDAVTPGTGFATGTTLASTEAGNGRGTASVGGALDLQAPTTTHEGSYVTWITVTLL